MKRTLATINLVILIFLATINSIFIFGISKDKELSDFYFKNIELSESYLDIEVKHMHEVKALVNAFLIITLVGLFIFLLSYKYSQVNFQIVGISLLSLAVLFIIALLFFESFFYKWHELFFVSDNWLLPEGAKLLQDYPSDYFKKKFILFDALLAFFGIIILVGDKEFKKNSL